MARRTRTSEVGLSASLAIDRKIERRAGRVTSSTLGFCSIALTEATGTSCRMSTLPLLIAAIAVEASVSGCNSACLTSGCSSQ